MSMLSYYIAFEQGYVGLDLRWMKMVKDYSVKGTTKLQREIDDVLKLTTERYKATGANA